MKNKIVTFGEIMMRLATYNYERIVQAQQFQVTYGGGEANVAVSLSQLGHDVYFVSSVPANVLGDAAVNRMQAFGVNTQYMIRNSGRLGLYFLEHGASIRPSRVTYDRSNSSIATAQADVFKWGEIFENSQWFHFTGITPALSDLSASNCLNAVKKAQEKGVSISCDLNYRKKLWTREKAREVMSELVRYVDVIIANEEDAADVFGIKSETTDVTSGDLSIDHYKRVAQDLIEISGAKLVAITLRESISASDNNWAAMVYDGSSHLLSRKYPIHLVDRVGGGDSFAAGLIHGVSQNWPINKSLDFAVAASALKQTIPGDMNLVHENEVMDVVNGDLSGRVQR